MLTSLCEISRPADKGGIGYSVLTELSEICSVAPHWSRVLDSTCCNRAFSSPEWYISSFAADTSISPVLIVAIERDEVVGLLPLARGKAAAMEFPNFLSDYSDAIVTHDDPALTAGLLAHAVSTLESHQHIVLSRVRHDSACVKAIQVLRDHHHLNARFRETGAYLYSDTSTTYEEFLGSKSRMMRKGIKRAERSARDSGFNIVMIKGDLLSPDVLPDTFLDLVLNRHTGKSIFRLESGQVFAKQALPELFEHGRLQVFGAVRDSKVVAMDLCVVGSNSLCTWNGGFLEEAAFFSPGTVLTAFGIRTAIEMGCKDYDFLRGNEQYKTKWATGSHVVGEITLSRSLEPAGPH